MMIKKITSSFILLFFFSGCTPPWATIALQTTHGDHDGSVLQPQNSVENRFLPKSSAVAIQQTLTSPPKQQAVAENRAKTSLRRNHAVSKGETVYALSRRYNTPLRQIIDLNGFTPPYKLAIGQTVIIPATKLHLVKQGDTLYGLSRRYDLSVSELARRNRIKEPYIISVGQLLLLPDTVTDTVTDTMTKIALVKTVESKPVKKTAVILETSSSKVAKPVKLEPNKELKKSTSTRKKQPKKTPTKKPKQKKNDKAEILSPGALSFLRPIEGKIITKYGQIKNGQRNEGIDIAANEGTPIKAAEGGIVAYSGDDIDAFGNLILLRHNNGFLTAYGHNAENRVRRGDTVKKGQVIATVGQTGSVGQPQLHFEIRNRKKVYDPSNYLPK